MPTIKAFVEKYNSFSSESLKNDYLKSDLKVTAYLPFLRKDALATILAERSTYKYESYTKEDGTIGQKKTDVIRVNSTVQYLLFCRVIIENYTNLTVETEGFFEEYDLLNESGLLDKIMQMIPEKEITEFKMICDMKKDDIVFNQSTPKAFINQQIERITTIASVTLKPVLDKLVTELENMDEKDIDKLSKALERGLKRIK